MLKWLVFIYLTLTLVSCQTTPPAPPVSLATMWNGRIYVGDSKRFGVAQSLQSPIVSCMDPAINRMICMTLEDYTSLMQYFIQATCVASH